MIRRIRVHNFILACASLHTYKNDSSATPPQPPKNHHFCFQSLFKNKIKYKKVWFRKLFLTFNESIFLRPFLPTFNLQPWSTAIINNQRNNTATNTIKTASNQSNTYSFSISVFPIFFAASTRWDCWLESSENFVIRSLNFACAWMTRGWMTS